MTEKKLKKAQQDLEREQNISRLMVEMSRHIGKANAIGAGELFRKVFGRDYEGNKITGTRGLRKVIEAVKYGPHRMLICHSCCTIRSGYYLASSESERREFFAREDRKVKKKIGRLARLHRMTESAYSEKFQQFILPTTFYPGLEAPFSLGTMVFG